MQPYQTNETTKTNQMQAKLILEMKSTTTNLEVLGKKKGKKFALKRNDTCSDIANTQQSQSQNNQSNNRSIENENTDVWNKPSASEQQIINST